MWGQQFPPKRYHLVAKIPTITHKINSQHYILTFLQSLLFVKLIERTNKSQPCSRIYYSNVS
jgi:hypothetical protein